MAITCALSFDAPIGAKFAAQALEGGPNRSAYGSPLRGRATGTKLCIFNGRGKAVGGQWRRRMMEYSNRNTNHAFAGDSTCQRDRLRFGCNFYKIYRRLRLRVRRRPGSLRPLLNRPVPDRRRHHPQRRRPLPIPRLHHHNRRLLHRFLNRHRTTLPILCKLTLSDPHFPRAPTQTQSSIRAA